MINFLISFGILFGLFLLAAGVHFLIEIRKLLKRREYIRIITPSEIMDDEDVLAYSEITEILHKSEVKEPNEVKLLRGI